MHAQVLTTCPTAVSSGSTPVSLFLPVPLAKEVENVLLLLLLSGSLRARRRRRLAQVVPAPLRLFFKRRNDDND